MSISTQKTHCIKCNDELSGKQRKYCSNACKGKAHQYNSYKKQQERAYLRKSNLINRSGGKCSICGYCKNSAALSFHHKDPSQKSFPLDSRNLSNRTLDTIEGEYQKCELLCLNCHAETHHPDHKIL